MSSSRPSVPLVGSPVVWTAVARGHGATPVYQFSVARAGDPFQVVRDFSTSKSFRWNPMQQGTYTIRVTVKDGFFVPTGETVAAFYSARPRAVGSRAVVSPTSNPLVALYSAPSTIGRSMSVQFKPLGSNGAWSSTAPLPVVRGRSTDFLVAGMLPDTTYLMRHVVADGRTSVPLTFRTGSLPTYLTFPNYTVRRAPGPGSDPTANVVFHAGYGAPSHTVNTLATDRLGRVIWYYDQVANAFTPDYAPTFVPGGTVFVFHRNSTAQGGADVLREVDLAGDTLRETNVGAVNAELAALGKPLILQFHHDAQRLPNGGTAVLAATTRIVNYRGKPTQYTGDMVLVLDQNFQVQWVWDPFKWLDTNRLPTQGEGPSDWMHSNSVAWSPLDGNLLVSMRSQDMVVKIAYANGAGDGHVVWRLGQGGDFSIRSSDPSPWFSHQHDVRYVNATTLEVFDNGNTRQRTDRNAHSRGQVLVLDEKTRRATLVVNADLGSYSPAMGSAQALSNGNFVFGSVGVPQTIEVLPNGTQVHVLQDNTFKFVYRSYILRSLYDGSANSPGSSVFSTDRVPNLIQRRRELQQRLAELRQNRLEIQQRRAELRQNAPAFSDANR